MRPLTERQQSVLDVVQRYSREHGFPPTLREIGAALDLSNVSAVRGHVAALEKKGYIAKESDKARSIRVLRHPSIYSRFKRKLHEIVGTDEAVLHRIVYAAAAATQDREALFCGDIKEAMTDELEKEGVEHGWEVLEMKVEPDHVIVILAVWPNHSAQTVVHRIKAAGDAVARRYPSMRGGGKLWAKGYAVTTDVGQFDQMTRLLLEQAGKETAGDAKNGAK